MMKIPKTAKIKIDTQGSDLKAFIEFPDKDVIKLDNVDSINTVLRNIYEKEGVSLANLLNAGRVIIRSTRVWDKYNVTGNGYFCKIVKDVDKKVIKDDSTKTEPTKVEPVKTEPVKTEPAKSEPVKTEPVKTEPAKTEPVKAEPVKTEPVKTEPVKAEPVKAEPKKSNGTVTRTKGDSSNAKVTKGKTRILLRDVNRNSLVWFSLLVLTTIGITGTIHIIKHRKSNNSNPSNNNNEYRQEISNDDKQYTANLPSDEELINNRSVYEEVFHPEENASNQEYVDYGYQENQGRYAYLGSCVEDKDMRMQLDEIDNSVYQQRQFQYENYVVADDFDAIYAISNLRNAVLNHICSPKEFLDQVVEYIFEDGYYVNSSFIEKYESLNPLAKFIVIRMTQGVMQWDTNYTKYVNGELYNFDKFAEEFDIKGDAVFNVLMQNERTR